MNRRSLPLSAALLPVLAVSLFASGGSKPQLQIACPESVVPVTQAVLGWTRSEQRVPFTASESPSGKISCFYTAVTANERPARVTWTLNKSLPAGYVCERLDARSWKCNVPEQDGGGSGSGRPGPGGGSIRTP